MAKDKRYTVIKNLVTGGYIKSFEEIFETLPKSVLYKDLGMNSARFSKLLKQPELFILKDLFRIASLIGTDEKIILDLVYGSYASKRKSR